ncbi:uncharacterized protein LOC131937672 isoform X2 [Physella acuta]|nr:uncharacterized protein LOC131937672 isoform X2 [Physella acuta]
MSFDALDGLGCSQFKSIIMDAQLEETFRSPQALTLFVFNDTAYALMPPYRLGTLYDKTSGNNLGAKEYVNSFTLTEAVETSAFSDVNPFGTYSVRNRKVFLNKREIKSGNIASGTPVPTKYFCNGAMLIRPNIQVGQHLIHIIDQVLDMPLEDNALAYVAGNNPSNLTYLFFSKIMEFLRKAPQEDGEYNYNKQVQQILAGKKVTFFIPSDEALNLIPSQKLSELQGNTRLMLEIITLHIVPNQVLYTSLVNHNEIFNTQFNSGAVVFRKNFNREAVYVTGALKGGGTVTAKLNPGNRTVLNGVVHQIDAMLGFVYKTAIEEIEIDPNTQHFEQLIFAARKDLQNYITATSGVVVFVPTNPAMYAIANVYPNYINNQSLINMVLEMSLLLHGQSINVMDYNGGYEAYKTAVSRYNGRLIKVYTEGDVTWVEGGYVKARVIKPDIGVTNGAVHQIDAVFGIPTRDIPYTVFCEDWLVSTYMQLKYVGLDAYMRDPTLTRNQDCVFSASAAAGQVPPAAGTWQTNTGLANQNQANTGQANQNQANTGQANQNQANTGQANQNQANTGQANQNQANTGQANQNQANTGQANQNQANTGQDNQDLFEGVCRNGDHRCEFTFFVPNGTAIDNFAATTYGQQIMNDQKRWRWVLRRLITFREKIYIDQLAFGAPRSYYADNGEEIIIQTDSRSNIPSGQRTTYIMFGGVRAQVIHSDIGATNGVIHIINSLLFVPEDLSREFSEIVNETTPSGNLNTSLHSNKHNAGNLIQQTSQLAVLFSAAAVISIAVFG